MRAAVMESIHKPEILKIKDLDDLAKKYSDVI